MKPSKQKPNKPVKLIFIIKMIININIAFSGISIEYNSIPRESEKPIPKVLI